MPGRSKDWEKIKALGWRLARGRYVVVDEPLKDLLRNFGAELGLGADRVHGRLSSESGVRALLLEESACIQRGAGRLKGAIKRSNRRAQTGDVKGARALVERFIEQEPVPWYRDLGRTQLKSLRDEVAPPDAVAP